MVATLEWRNGVPDKYREYKYDFAANPASDESRGINCQKLVHKVYGEEFGIALLKGMWSKEIVEDTTVLFRDVDIEKETLQLGDIVAFTPKKIPKEFAEDPVKSSHLTIYLGKNEEGRDTFIHANKKDDGVSIWKLEQFAEDYNGIRAIKRLQDEWHKTYIQPLLHQEQIAA